MAVQTDVIAANNVGTTVTSGGTSAFAALPTLVGSVKPKFVRLQATGFVYVKLGPTGVVATVNDLMLSANESVILITAGADFIAYLQETAAAKLNIVPLDA